MKRWIREGWWEVLKAALSSPGTILPTSLCVPQTGSFLNTVLLGFVVQLLSHVWLLSTPSTATHQASLSFFVSWSLLTLMSIESVMPSNYLILCWSLLFLPSIFPSIWIFSNELCTCVRWPNYWSFSFSISPSSEYSGLISFKIDWFGLLSI